MHYLSNNLKHLSLLLLLCILALSCDDDDDPEPTIEGILWTQVTFEYIDCNEESLNSFNDVVCDDQNCTTFILENGTATYTGIENGTTDTFTVNYTLSGNTINVGGLSATFEVQGDRLIITNPPEFDGCVLIDAYKKEG